MDWVHKKGLDVVGDEAIIGMSVSNHDFHPLANAMSSVGMSMVGAPADESRRKR